MLYYPWFKTNDRQQKAAKNIYLPETAKEFDTSAKTDPLFWGLNLDTTSKPTKAAKKVGKTMARREETPERE